MSSAAERLERALEVFLQHAEAGGDEVARVIEAHPDLRDLLVPMFARDGEGSGENEGELAVLGDFRLVRELGRGGMGIVYEAWQRSLDRPVALKVLSPALMASPSAVARFRREAAAVGRLRHVGIVEVHGFGNEGDRHWFAMGLIDGEPLTRCRDRFASPQRAVALLVQVLEALDHAHRAGLVHRDVKPGNVIVRADDAAVLTDFGLAHDAELPSVTTDGSFLGTLEYASPEQLQGVEVDARTDLWSVGVMLYELLAGERPFVRGSATAVMKAILVEEPRALRRRNADVSTDLAAIVDRAMQKDPARRYATARDFLGDLRAWQSGGVVSARAPGPAERVVRWMRREPWRATTAAVLVLGAPMLTATLGYLWANAPRIAAAAAAEIAQHREDVLTTAWLALAEEDVSRGFQALESYSPAADDFEVPIAWAALLVHEGRRAEAVQRLAPFAKEPAVQHVLAMVEDRDQGAELGLSAAIATTPIESFVLGMVAYEQVHVHRRSERNFAIATRHMGTAVAMASQPRSAFLFWWMVSAARARNEDAFLAAFSAYERHFPASHGLELACILCASMLPIERGLVHLRRADFAKMPRGNLALALLLTRSGALDEAVRAYRAGLAADPKNVRAWLQFAELLEKQKQLPAAAEAARAVLAIDANNAEAWSRLGAVLGKQGDAVAAREAFLQATKAAPEQWRLHFNLGLMLRDAGDYEAALREFQAAASCDPSQTGPWELSAAMLRRASRKEEALLADLRALQTAPKDWNLCSTVAVQLSQAGLLVVAVEHATRATELGPKEPKAWSRLAEVLLDMPVVDGPRALQAARRADELAKGADARGTWLLARAEGANGDQAAAIARLDALLAGTKVPASVRQLAEAELSRLRAAK